jgi:hypothetical protein
MKNDPDKWGSEPVAWDAKRWTGCEAMDWMRSGGLILPN